MCELSDPVRMNYCGGVGDLEIKYNCKQTKLLFSL